MNQVLKELTFGTRKEKELVNITSQVEGSVSKSGIKNGLCVVCALHATGGIIINEDEEKLKVDFLDFIEKILPPNNSYKHNIHDDNATAHMASSLFSQNQTLIIESGRLQRGTWQDIFFVELDGPRNNRRVLIYVIGE